MKKFFLPLSVLCLLASFFLFSAFKADDTIKPATAAISKASIKKSANSTNSTASASEAFANKLYDSLQLSKIGLTREALVYAYRGQQYLEQTGILNNPSVLTVCDFSQSSSSKRMYIIDVKNFHVLLNTYVAHGRNSGLNYAEHFSNSFESLESSMGFYITKNTYEGKHGLSLKLSGLEEGINDNAEARAIVIHGAPYVGDGRAESSYMGRSFGCPAVPQELASKIIDFIKDGTCLFIYSPNQRYLHGSRILNA